MSRNVNLYTSNWQWTGQDVPCLQATVGVELHWVGSDGQARQWSGTLTFPNDLQDVPTPWLKEILMDLMLRAARKKLGVDE